MWKKCYSVIIMIQNLKSQEKETIEIMDSDFSENDDKNYELKKNLTNMIVWVEFPLWIEKINLFESFSIMDWKNMTFWVIYHYELKKYDFFESFSIMDWKNQIFWLIIEKGEQKWSHPIFTSRFCSLYKGKKKKTKQ